MSENTTIDSGAKDLFCNEQTKGLCFDDDGHLVQPPNDVSRGTESEALMVHLPSLSEECIGFMVEREREFLPRDDYVERLRSGQVDVGLRREALDWLFKACAHFSFGEMCLYLAMTYLDRFLSIYEVSRSSLEKGGKNWAIQLVAVACLSIAAKFQEVNVPSILDLQAGTSELLFEAKTIQRMEILVLKSLKWKIKGIEFLEFRPSEIAAAVAMCVAGEIQTMDIDKALSFLIGVDKVRVVKCFKLIQELPSLIRTSVATTTTSKTSEANSVISSFLLHSPNGVLEAVYLSYKRDERSVESCPSSPQSSPDTKRRKLDQKATVGGDS